jgi:peptide/nickel transport system permease protein
MTGTLPTANSTATSSTAGAVVSLSKKPPRTLWKDAWRQFRRHKLAMMGSWLIFLIVLFVTLGPLFHTIDPRKIDFSATLANSSAKHPFGTDSMGHDLMARAMWGGRISILVGLLSMFVGITFGTLVGALSGFFGGAVDAILSRFTELCIALPRLPLLMIIIYLFRDRLRTIMGPESGILILIVLVIGLLGWMTTARVVRASFLSAKEKEYVEAAISIGSSKSKLIFKHILPNVMSPVIVTATLSIGWAILTESSLSFLGLGFPPDVPTWGRMLFDAQNYLDIAPLMAIVPGVLIFLVVISINYIGDGLRDALDPQQRSR